MELKEMENNGENLTQRMEKQLQTYKYMMDHAYDTTLEKYDSSLANEGILDFYLNGRLTGFTRDNNARWNMIVLEQKPFVKEQILLDYAISSFISNNMECDISNNDLTDYVNDKEGKLNYDSLRATKVLAMSCAVNPQWAFGLLTTNNKLKQAVTSNMLIERYGLNKRKELDTCHRAKLVTLTDRPNKQFEMSKDILNNEIKVMLRDFGYDDESRGRSK